MKFWNWIKVTNEQGQEERVLELNGTIADESWFDDDITRGNAHFFLQEGYEHCYEHVMQSLYNYLPVLFG